jgi:hypothetical protein
MASRPPRRKRTPAILASDAERDYAITALREAAAEGRLTLEEFSSRVGTALSARTRDELVAVTADLPAAAPAAFAGGMGDPIHYWRRPVQWSLALMSSTRRMGAWRVAYETTAMAVMGSVVLDLRTATIEAPVVTVNALAWLGTVDVIVPEGVEVDLEGLAIMGSRDVRLTSYEHRPGMPVVRVRAYALLGSVTVRNNRGWIRETYDQLKAHL